MSLVTKPGVGVLVGSREVLGHKTEEEFLGMGVPGLIKEDGFTDV